MEDNKAYEGGSSSDGSHDASWRGNEDAVDTRRKKLKTSGSSDVAVDELVLSPEEHDHSHVESKDSQLEAKREYNRKAAARARARTKSMVAFLKNTVESLTRKANDLQRENEKLKDEVKMLSSYKADAEAAITSFRNQSVASTTPHQRQLEYLNDPLAHATMLLRQYTSHPSAPRAAAVSEATEDPSVTLMKLRNIQNQLTTQLQTNSATAPLTLTDLITMAAQLAQQQQQQQQQQRANSELSSRNLQDFLQQLTATGSTASQPPIPSAPNQDQVNLLESIAAHVEAYQKLQQQQQQQKGRQQGS